MESGRYRLTRVYTDILRQIPTQIPTYFVICQVTVTMEVCYLSQCMRAGICTPTATDFYWLVQYSGECSFQLLLDCIICSWQSLPAFVSATVVANIKPQISHMLPIPLWLPVRCQQKTGSFLFRRKLEHGPLRNVL